MGISNFKRDLLVCFLAGTTLVLSFAPFRFGYIAFASLSVLFFLCRSTDARSSFYYGFLFAFGQFVVGVSWVYVSLHTYGGMPLWMGAIAVVLFAGILSLFTALACYSSARLFPAATFSRFLALAVFYVLFEWLKSWILTGFAWLELGVSQTSTWLFALAPIGGVYLVSLVVAVFAACVVSILCKVSRFRSSILLVFLVVATGFANAFNWSTPIGDPIQVGVVQGNIAIDRKWQANFRDGVISKLSQLSSELADIQSSKDKPLDMLVWPETALPLYRQQTDETFWRSIKPKNVALLTGLVDSPSPSQTYNAAVLSCDDSQQIYRKQHLVPFGEYLPLRFMLDWILDYLQLPMSDFSSWSKPQSLQCGSRIKIGLSICYEDAFSSELRRSVGDATLLVNISEDAWFGDSFAPHQRLQMGQMRARELARPMVRSANSGPSAFIDANGLIVEQSEQFIEQSFAVEVQPMVGDTPYKALGNWPVLLCFLIMAVLIALRQFTLRRI